MPSTSISEKSDKELPEAEPKQSKMQGCSLPP